MSIVDFINGATPHLIADIRLYSSEEGGRTQPILPGFRCIGMCSQSPPRVGHDVLPLLFQPLAPGETRRIGFALLSPEDAIPSFTAAGRFYLWDGRFIGEAILPCRSTAATPPPDT